MSSVARMIPDEGAMLCEGCGYILDGLPEHSQCPECGKPIGQSLPKMRAPLPWEKPNLRQIAPRDFWRTTFAIVLRPARFYRQLAARPAFDASQRFARTHLHVSSLILGLAAFFQFLLLDQWTGSRWLRRLDSDVLFAVGCGAMLAVCAAVALGALVATSRIAARLTAWEAAYRGLRLPLHVVRRALNFHAAHYLPVAVIGAMTSGGYFALTQANLLSELHGPLYLYILCAEVILAAGYLFITYWTGMRNMLYANA